MSSEQEKLNRETKTLKEDTMNTLCRNLNQYVPQRLKYLNNYPGEGALWGGLVSVALLEEYLTGVTFECMHPCVTSNLHCGLFLWFKMLILSFLPLEPHLPLAIILTTCHQCSSPQRLYVQINQSLYKFLLLLCYITAAEK